MNREKNLWNALTVLPTGDAVLEDWKGLLGSQFDVTRPFLRPTDEQAECYPCTHRFKCQCRHNVVVHSPSRIAAVCDCEDGCETIALEPKDLIVWKVDESKLCEAIRSALGLQVGSPGLLAGMKSRQVGTWARMQIPVFYYSPPSAEWLILETERLFGFAREGFVLLTPTYAYYTPELEIAMQRQRGVLLPLGERLVIGAEGIFSLDGMEGFGSILEKRLGNLSREDLAKTIEKMGRDIEAVARGTYELQTARARLEQMQGENLFRFVQKIDSDAFRIVCAILAHGDVAKASRGLKMKDSTVRDVLRSWERRGEPYRGLLRLVQWRKGSRIKGTVPFNDAMLYQKNLETNRESVFRDVLDGLMGMTEGNWEDVCEELKEMLSGD
ncbi:MAG: hypothetical protein ACK4UN_13910 [Limisphaerales bacterium]